MSKRPHEQDVEDMASKRARRDSDDEDEQHQQENDTASDTAPAATTASTSGFSRATFADSTLGPSATDSEDFWIGLMQSESNGTTPQGDDAPPPPRGLGRGRGGLGLGSRDAASAATTTTWKKPSTVPPSVLLNWATIWLPFLAPDPCAAENQAKAAAEDAKAAARNADNDEEDDDGEGEDDDGDGDDGDDDGNASADDKGGDAEPPTLTNSDGVLRELYLYWRWRSAPLLEVAIKRDTVGGGVSVSYHERLLGYCMPFRWVCGASRQPQQYANEREAVKDVAPFVRQLLLQNFVLQYHPISALELESYRLPELLNHHPTSFDLGSSELAKMRRGSLHRVKIADLYQYGFPTSARFGDVVAFMDYRNLENFIVDQDFPRLWSPRNHTQVATGLQEQVLTLFLLRNSQAESSVLTQLPNELMFLLCEWLSRAYHPMAVEEPSLFLNQSQTEYGYVLPPKFRPPWVPESVYTSFFDMSAEVILECIQDNVDYEEDTPLDRAFLRLLQGDLR